MNQELPHHLQFERSRSVLRRRAEAAIRSNRFALIGSFFFALFIPEILHPLRLSQALGVHRPEPEFYAAAAALIMAHVGIRRVGVMPLVNDKTVVLPTFLAAFGMAYLFLALASDTVGKYHLVTGLVMGVLWYVLIAVLRGRLTVPRMGYVGRMPIDDDLRERAVDWIHLKLPKLPKDIHAIVFDSHEEVTPEWERFFGRAVLRKIPVYDATDLREMSIGRVRLRQRPELVFGQLLPSQPYLRIKRFLDILGAILALPIALPILAIAALAIQLEGPGPTLFCQRRVGYQGRIFTCYKLRTMCVDIDGPAFTTADDRRITRVGRYVRKWRIDELPQIINIFRGQMSWIGPRPEAFVLAKQYQRQIPYYAYRYTVRPGITGWAAVHQGNVAEVDAATVKLEYDFFYIKYFSPWLDFMIGLMTIRTVLTGFGSR
jgi:lipopolysaccharide/colanic/teichoic acid biosynthesis glycosyltransferase